MAQFTQKINLNKKEVIEQQLDNQKVAVDSYLKENKFNFNFSNVVYDDIGNRGEMPLLTFEDSFTIFDLLVKVSKKYNFSSSTPATMLVAKPASGKSTAINKWAWSRGFYTLDQNNKTSIFKCSLASTMPTEIMGVTALEKTPYFNGNSYIDVETSCVKPATWMVDAASKNNEGKPFVFFGDEAFNANPKVFGIYKDIITGREASNFIFWNTIFLLASNIDEGLYSDQQEEAVIRRFAFFNFINPTGWKSKVNETLQNLVCDITPEKYKNSRLNNIRPLDARQAEWLTYIMDCTDNPLIVKKFFQSFTNKRLPLSLSKIKVINDFLTGIIDDTTLTPVINTKIIDVNPIVKEIKKTIEDSSNTDINATITNVIKEYSEEFNKLTILNSEDKISIIEKLINGTKRAMDKS